MKKVLFGTLIGFVLFGSGLVAGFFAIQSIRDGGSPFLILASIVLCSVGMFILYKSGRMDTFKSKIAPMQSPVANGSGDFAKKQQMVKEFNESNTNREKLKLLEAAERAREEK
jgi:hypothetical protein